MQEKKQPKGASLATYLREVGMTWPFFLQVMEGVGNPPAGHHSLTSSPATAVTLGMARTKGGPGGGEGGGRRVLIACFVFSGRIKRSGTIITWAI